MNLCSPFSSHIPYSAKQQVLRGSLELRKQWFPGFLWHSTKVVLWFQQPAFISKGRRVKSVAKRSKTGPIFCVPCGCWGLSKIELVHFVHLEFDEGHEGCYVFFSVSYVRARVSWSSSKISCLMFVAVFFHKAHEHELVQARNISTKKTCASYCSSSSQGPLWL